LDLDDDVPGDDDDEVGRFDDDDDEEADVAAAEEVLVSLLSPVIDAGRMWMCRTETLNLPSPSDDNDRRLFFNSRPR
jgi:hypothetical protein